MQPTDKRKKSLNDLAANYRPLGPRDLLAAALAMRSREEAIEAEDQRAEAGRSQRTAA